MQSMRQRILEILKEKNRATVEQLSAELEITPVTVRHHLDVMRGEGLVDAPLALRRAGPGRPQYTYGLTDAASDLFPRRYHSLADLMLDEIRERVSKVELDQIVSGVADRMAAQAPSSLSNKKPREIMNQAVRVLNDQGYVASWEKTLDGEYVLHTCNCPFERVAQAHSEVCTIDTTYLARLVGAAPQRMSHMASGDGRCSYRFQLEFNHLS